MREIERRVWELDAIDPAQERVQYVISDCPEGDIECDKRQIRFLSNGGKPGELGDLHRSHSQQRRCLAPARDGTLHLAYRHAG